MSMRTTVQTPTHVHIARQKQELMFRSVQKNWELWMRAVTVTAAAVAILVSALAMSPEIDHHVPLTQPAITFVAGTGTVDTPSVQLVPDTNCHGGLSCVLAIMPSDSLALTRFESAQEFSRLTHYDPSHTGYLPFQPPRILSQV